ncbi:hypothetical protein M436DRAFT_42449 [Aureobasidium namibiae CBS 147.97]|uniref:Nitrogen permease regulator 3 n=1 Tax=Aureobasidium namibiae CBS 147.97 TaxID=1043004 RepID=A0A074WPG1_9PEZI|nr:uncharacterized protein M436DRAFT_42449 [Aureobasidium namibiae CBS 147.97]KEQ75025.1 hypothetical protein M436DRAFT_42449 [Aureobasidium namibiae CBS 147.97]
MPIRPFSLPPNPSLVAVVVIIRTRSGPRLVFHYPGTPEAVQRNTSWHFGSANSDSEEASSSDDDQTVVSDDESTTSSRQTARPSIASQSRAAETISSRRTTRTLHSDAPDNDEDDDDLDNLDVERNTPEWEKLLGYPVEGLEMMLSPPSSMHKKRFEVMLDDLVFLGYPIFVRDDGTWKKKKTKRRASTKDGKSSQGGHGQEDDGNDSGSDNENDDDDEEGAEDNDMFSPPLSPLTPRRPPQNGDLPGSFPSEPAMSEAASETGSANSNQDEMTMFHVVFVMNPPALEYHIRLQEMYDNVVKKFAKALRYEQARSNAIYQDAKKMQSLKAQAKENKTPMSVLWPTLIASCSLAKAVAILYTSIASNKIAHISIGEGFEASIQIPQAISTPYVPTPTEPQLPGLWLTTANSLSDDGQSLSPHAALLLLEDKDTMLKEIEGDGKEAGSPLAFFIRELTPTKSLTKLSAALSLPLSDVQFLARHLIYWRRARAIPPLHIRDSYIVSPNCDMRQLTKAMPLYAQQFSALPSLPKMLQNLSGKPIQYGFLIPSKDHKPAYMDILAWLLRGGWATQLRTFAWVKVSPAVKVAVAVKLKQEFEDRMAKRPPSALKTSAAATHSRLSSHSADTRRISEDSYDGGISEVASSRLSVSSAQLLSPTLSRSASASDAGSNGSGRTAIPPPAGPQRADTSPNLHASKELAPSSPSVLSNSSVSGHEDDASTIHSAALPSTDIGTYRQTLVLSPHKASTEESRWLAHIGANLEDGEVKEHWGVLVKHFDGKRAMEEVAAREGLKRSKVQGLLHKLEQEGVLYMVRHW